MKICHYTYLIAFVFVSCQPVRAISTGAEAQPAPQSVQHQYTFNAKEIPVPGGNTIVSVRLSDTIDEAFHRRIVAVLADAGGMTRMDRAEIIAARMQMLTQTDPEWPRNLRVAQVEKVGWVVVDGKTGQFIITADAGAAKAANTASEREYAVRIVSAIQSRLRGIILR